MRSITPRLRQKGLDLENLDDNLAYAKYLYEKEGLRPDVFQMLKPYLLKTAHW